MKDCQPKPVGVQAKKNTSFFGREGGQPFFQSGRQTQPFFTGTSAPKGLVQTELNTGGEESPEESIRRKAVAQSPIPLQIQKSGEDETEKTAMDANKFADTQLDQLVNDFEATMTLFRNWYADQDEGDDDFAKRFKAQIQGGYSSCISSNLAIGAKLMNVFQAASSMIAENSDNFVSSIERSVKVFHEAVENNLLGQSADLLQKGSPDLWSKILDAHKAGGDWKALLYQAGIPMPGNNCQKNLLTKLIHEYKLWEWDQHSDEWKGIYRMEDPYLNELNTGAEKEAGKMVSKPQGAEPDVILRLPDVPLFDGDHYKKDWEPAKISADFIKVPIPDLGVMIDIGGELSAEAHFYASYGPGILTNLKIGVTTGQAALFEAASSLGLEGAGLLAIADLLHLDNFRASADLRIPASITASAAGKLVGKLAASAFGIVDIAVLESGLEASASAGATPNFGGQVSIYYANGELTFNHRLSLSLDLDLEFILKAFIEAGLLGAHWKKSWELFHGQKKYNWAVGTEIDLDYDDKPTFEINSFGKKPPLLEMVDSMLQQSEDLHQTKEELDVQSGNSKGDAIEIYWYKMREDYPQTIELQGKHGPEHFHFGKVEEFDIPDMDRLTGTPGGPSLRRKMKGGSVVEFGAGEEHIPKKDKSTVWKKNRASPTREADSSDVQRALRALMILHGHNMKALNEQSDHVQDLQFEGFDQMDNIWPLNAHINQSSREFLKQIVVVKDKTGKPKKMELGDPALVGKYFRIIGFRHF
jgi:hypothetical protein